MNVTTRLAAARRCRIVTAGLSLLALSACSVLHPPSTPPPALYSLDSVRQAAVVMAPVTAPTLLISPPRDAAGFGSKRMIYVRVPHQIEYFSQSEWVDPPAHMLGPLLVAALENTSTFRAVVLAPGAASGDLRLDTEVIRLQHEFLRSPSRVRFTLRATLFDDKTRRVLAWREFDGYETADSEDAYGGVLAANRALQAQLGQLSVFCTEVALRMSQPSYPAPSD